MVLDLTEILIDQPPIARFATLVLFQAITDKAEEVIFELKTEIDQETRSHYEELLKAGDPDKYASSALAAGTSFTIAFRTGNKLHHLPFAPGRLFEPAMRIFLNAAEIPYWTRTPVSGEIQTQNPATKWALKSDNLSVCVRLLRQP